MKGICGAECSECVLYKNNSCEGCEKTNGCPFCKKCWIAKYIEVGGEENFKKLQKELINEFNSLNISGLPKIKELYPLHGEFVNLEYTLPNGEKIKYLNNNESYLGNQVECEFNDENLKRYFGIIANMTFLLVSEYDEDGSNPEIVVYKKR
jgi:hypothetical protein